jgi:hypothetical protein
MNAHEEREWQTRKKWIDPQLQGGGWKLVEFDASMPRTAYRRHAITEFPTDNGPADYALGVDSQLLGIVEAKKLTVSAAGKLTQAERYSRGVTNSALGLSQGRRAGADSCHCEQPAMPAAQLTSLQAVAAGDTRSLARQSVRAVHHARGRL